MRCKFLHWLLPALLLAHSTLSITLDSLARDLHRAESIRQIKDVQKSFAQLAQFGQWQSMTSLFSPHGTLQWGNDTATGHSNISTWLQTDAGDMDGIQPGSLNTMIIENPLISLSIDGQSAKGRWNGLRFMGDGKGGTRIEGGIYENEYTLERDGWKISLLHYYPLYAGPYKEGWRNIGGPLPMIPYHFTPSNAGLPIPPPTGDAPPTTLSVEQLEARINRLNDEDSIRNLQHAYGYYVDRRMWTDVLDLFSPNSCVTINELSYYGRDGFRQALGLMGTEDLTQGILNDHPIFDLVVEVSPDGKEAVARGTEIGMLGDANTGAASCEFSVFRNTFVKEGGMWKMKDLNISKVMVADYSTGWGFGSTTPLPPLTSIPTFLNTTRALPSTSIKPNPEGPSLTELLRRLSRSAAYDGVENISSAYGYYLDDLQCSQLGAIHARNGHKLSPFTGWYRTPSRITTACQTVNGNTTSAPLRASISFYWRPQAVILVSEDGRSATLRARLLQPSTSVTKAGSFNGAIYHDQMVLENGSWKLWSVTIDEFYYQSTNWSAGWSGASLPSPTPTTNTTTAVPTITTTAAAKQTSTSTSLGEKFPPDVTLIEVGERERGFQGGLGAVVKWPEIQRMWFGYSNLVSGRVPEWFWEGCVPCKVRPGWRLSENGYMEPPSGPSPA